MAGARNVSFSIIFGFLFVWPYSAAFWVLCCSADRSDGVKAAAVADAFARHSVLATRGDANENEFVTDSRKNKSDNPPAVRLMAMMTKLATLLLVAVGVG